MLISSFGPQAGAGSEPENRADSTSRRFFLQAPTLEPWFSGDLSNDSSNTFRIPEENIRRRFGGVGLIFKDGKGFEQALKPGPWARIKMNIRPAVPNRNGHGTRWKIYLKVRRGFDAFADFHQSRKNDVTESRITLFRNKEERDGSLVWVPMQRQVFQEAFESGEWTIEYRFGHWKIRSPQGKQHLVGNSAFDQANNALADVSPVKSIQVKTLFGWIAFSKVSIDQIEHWPAADSFLKDANALDQLLGYYGDHDSLTELEKQFQEGQKGLVKLAEQYGTFHPAYSAILIDHGLTCLSRGDYATGIQHFQQAMVIDQSVLGVDHPRVGVSLNAAALAYTSLGDYAKAIEWLQKTAKLMKINYGEEDDKFAITQNNIGQAYRMMGKFEEAKDYYGRALAIHEGIVRRLNFATYGYATSLNNLGVLYQITEDDEKALEYLQRAHALRKQFRGPNHFEYASSLQNLANFYLKVGELDKAIDHYRQAILSWENAAGREHDSFAHCLRDLGDALTRAGKLTEANSKLVEATRILKKTLGDQHVKYAASLRLLAKLRMRTGDLRAAYEHLVETTHILRDNLGIEHPLYANTLHERARLKLLTGDYNEAIRLVDESIQLTRRYIEDVSVLQAATQQQQQVNALYERLSLMLTLSSLTGDSNEIALRHSVAWKGATLLRQKHYRRMMESSGTSSLFLDLQRTTAELANHLRQDPNRPMWRKRVKELRSRRKNLEQQIAQLSPDIPDLDVDLERLLGSLPRDAAFVDFLEFNMIRADPDRAGQFDRQEHLAAFVLLRNQQGKPDVGMIDLGPTKDLHRKILDWRLQFRETSIDHRQQLISQEAGKALNRMIWQPIEDRIRGLSQVVVSPDGMMGLLPLAALPDSDGKSYLIEKYRFNYTPVPRLLTENADHPNRVQRQILLVGGIDYDANSESAPSTPKVLDPDSEPLLAMNQLRSANTKRFPLLPETLRELQEIDKEISQSQAATKVTRLEGAAATESEFIKETTHHNFLHIATHGLFFRHPIQGVKLNRIDEFTNLSLAGETSLGKTYQENLDMLSGLVFAGANSSSAAKSFEDGILYSAQIAMTPLSHVELAVLSACETGIGADSNSAGEGLIGVQRAFQIAGVKRTVASLWKVDDLATRHLMSKFYHHIFYDRMSPDSALRNAQLWLLRNPQVLYEGRVRGITNVGNAQIQENVDAPNRQAEPTRKTHPKYWAAFVLSG